MKPAMFAVAVFLIVGIAVGSPRQSPKIEVPSLKVELDQFGGRPGSFYFVTNEQTMSDAVQLKESFAAMDRLEAFAASTASRNQPQLQQDLKTVRSFLLSVLERRNRPAGETAAGVEQRLNDAKGQYMCGACHGHGMMGGRGRDPMHMRD